VIPEQLFCGLAGSQTSVWKQSGETSSRYPLCRSPQADGGAKQTLNEGWLPSAFPKTEVLGRGEQDGFEVEFVTAADKTVTVLTSTTKGTKPFDNAEILHTREEPN